MWQVLILNVCKKIYYIVSRNREVKVTLTGGRTFSVFKFEMAFTHAEVPRKQLKVEDYKLKGMSVLDIEVRER